MQNGYGHIVDGNGGMSSSHGNGEIDMEDSDEEEDDATLLMVQPGFNHLLLILHDDGVMRFMKYVSAAAEGSQWDVCGKYEVVEPKDCLALDSAGLCQDSGLRAHPRESQAMLVLRK
ncbi:Oxoglutarate and iron-dependent oxygenase degradation C-term-domain-containing protein [Russula dissimulans]|nr:Oxoglutarate and iron-dependent oxygenase degradation C-term-domain-containing protein [Russula dissimulans]